MKISKLQGGLGNQMFQYAVARALEKDANENVYLDLSFLKEHSVATETFTVRDFELGIFHDIRSEILDDRIRKSILSKKVFDKISRWIHKLRPVIVNQIENEFVVIPDASCVYLDGYFQSERYFQTIRSSLIADFKFPLLDGKNETKKNKMLEENSVSIHVRRGDYIKPEGVFNYHGTLSLEYYKKAVEILKREDVALTFYVFSDDPQYVIENMGFITDKEVIDWNKGNDSWKDMALMQACKYHVVANSSFSWWGAWLSSESGMTIAPSKWFNDSVKYDIADFVPERWHKIDL